MNEAFKIVEMSSLKEELFHEENKFTEAVFEIIKTSLYGIYSSGSSITNVDIPEYVLPKESIEAKMKFLKDVIKKFRSNASYSDNRQICLMNSTGEIIYRIKYSNEILLNRMNVMKHCFSPFPFLFNKSLNDTFQKEEQIEEKLLIKENFDKLKNILDLHFKLANSFFLVSKYDMLSKEEKENIKEDISDIENFFFVMNMRYDEKVKNSKFFKIFHETLSLLKEDIAY